jgi:hypothetical protein
LKFIPTYNGQPLSIDSVYTNSLGQQLRVENIQFYLSNIYSHNGADSTLLKQAFLFTLLEPQTLSLNVSPQSFSSLSFGVGVPSNLNKNVDPSQYANANPLSVQGSNGMFWYWNTGYIFLKLDGISPQSTAPGHKLEYHMGGFKQPNNHLRTIRLETPDLQIQSQKTTTFEIKTDAAALLSSTHKVDFTTVPMVVDADKAADLADNVLHLFSVTRIQNGL